MDHGAQWTRRRVVYRSLRLDRAGSGGDGTAKLARHESCIAWEKVGGGGVGDGAAILFVAAIFETGLKREGRSQHSGLKVASVTATCNRRQDNPRQ